ncbi:MAG: excisionase family DNA-binding protein [Kofleriaceae bacterium]
MLLSPKELAAALGVSESTLKRWIDAGRIRATRTEGGHRRITLSDARAFVRATGAPVLHPEVLGMVEPPPAKPGKPAGPGDDLAFHRALVEGNGNAVHSWIQARYLAGTSIAALCDGPIRNAMHSIGELWEHDPDGIFLEHRATELCIQALANLRGMIEAPTTTIVAIGGAPEDDPYLLPSAMAALVLAAEGIRAVNLGADTPTSALRSALAHHRPRLLWISASSPLPLAQAHELAGFLAGLPHTVTAVVGGRHHATIVAADRSIRSAATMTELAVIARTML